MISKIRSLDPLAGIRGTFIMGFPGETDEDAAEVSAFVDDSDLDWIGVFAYSREVGTRSHDMAEQVPEVIARERAGRLSAVADAAMERRARSLLGETLEVLVERFDRDAGVWTGRSHREAPEIDGEIRFSAANGVRVGDYLRVRVTDCDGADLAGVLVG
jgi:tRNA A37 methylthiotransferase MiaB